MSDSSTLVSSVREYRVLDVTVLNVVLNSETSYGNCYSSLEYCRCTRADRLKSYLRYCLNYSHCKAVEGALNEKQDLDSEAELLDRDSDWLSYSHRSPSAESDVERAERGTPAVERAQLGPVRSPAAFGVVVVEPELVVPVEPEPVVIEPVEN